MMTLQTYTLMHNIEMISKDDPATRRPNYYQIFNLYYKKQTSSKNGLFARNVNIIPQLLKLRELSQL